MKTKSGHPTLRTLCAIGFVALAIGGCASVPAPTEQMAVSNAAIENAASSGGGEYAALEMRSARDKMARANAALQREDYEAARWLAEEAQVDARLAETMAQSAKARKAAVATSEDIRVLREEINRNSK
jgi:hypothetical protein